jgi:putative transposase
MKHKRSSDEQVIGVLKEHEAGGKVDDICRRHAIVPSKASAQFSSI